MAAILDKLPSDLGKQMQRWVALALDILSRGVDRVSQLIPQKNKPQGTKTKSVTASKSAAARSGDSPRDRLQLEQLKRAYAKLQQSSSESVTRLKSLEKMLSNEDLRHSVTLYYQLDSLWVFCHQLLVSHQKNLIQEFESTERDKLLDGYRAHQEKESKSVSDRIKRLEKTRKHLDLDKRKLMQEISTKKQLWHFFSRKELNLKLEEIRNELAPIEDELNKGKSDQNKLHSAQAPKLNGLNLVTKRAINNHLIAFAQFYYAYFSAGDISKLVRKVRKKSPADFNFGSVEKCQKLEQFLREKKIRVRALKRLRKTIAPQAKRIMAQTKYTNDKEAIPEVNSAGAMLSMDNFLDKKGENRKEKTEMINVVKDNYWDLNKLLIR